MSWDKYDDSGEFKTGPSPEQLEDQVEALAELLRTVYHGDWGTSDDIAGQVEDLFFELGLEL